ncbi:MAG: hypothetical protein KBC84_01165 [Proteobacteria bacterium]|nr:hypothetical protein [Pseudomonadota bacterium]
MSQSPKNVTQAQNKNSDFITPSGVVNNIKNPDLVLPPKQVNEQNNSNNPHTEKSLSASIEVSRVNIVETKDRNAPIFTIDTKKGEEASLLVVWKPSKHTNSFKQLPLNEMNNFPYSGDIGSVNKVTDGDNSTYLVKMPEGFSGKIEVLIGQSDVYVVSSGPEGAFNVEKKSI